MTICGVRSFFPLPYWKVPILGYSFLGMGPLVERQGQFKIDLTLVNEALNTLIEQTLTSRDDDDVEALEARDYDSMQDPSLLRWVFCVHACVWV